MHCKLSCWLEHFCHISSLPIEVGDCENCSLQLQQLRPLRMYSKERCQRRNTYAKVKVRMIKCILCASPYIACFHHYQGTHTRRFFGTSGLSVMLLLHAYFLVIYSNKPKGLLVEVGESTFKELLIVRLRQTRENEIEKVRACAWYGLCHLNGRRK